jgi:hypothetical protein
MKYLLLILVLTAISYADIPYTIKGDTIIWKPIPNDIQK